MELKFNRIEEAVTVMGKNPDGNKFIDFTLSQDNLERVSFVKIVDDDDFAKTANSPLINEFGPNFMDVVNEVKENLGKPVALDDEVVGELIGFETTMTDHYFVVRKLRHQCTINGVKKYKRTNELQSITACSRLFYINQQEIIITK